MYLQIDDYYLHESTPLGVPYTLSDDVATVQNISGANLLEFSSIFCTHVFEYKKQEEISIILLQLSFLGNDKCYKALNLKNKMNDPTLGFVF